MAARSCLYTSAGCHRIAVLTSRHAHQHVQLEDGRHTFPHCRLHICAGIYFNAFLDRLLNVDEQNYRYAAAVGRMSRPATAEVADSCFSLQLRTRMTPCMACHAGSMQVCGPSRLCLPHLLHLHCMHMDSPGHRLIRLLRWHAVLYFYVTWHSDKDTAQWFRNNVGRNCADPARSDYADNCKLLMDLCKQYRNLTAGANVTARARTNEVLSAQTGIPVSATCESFTGEQGSQCLGTRT
jgi:hypothetical protein